MAKRAVQEQKTHFEASKVTIKQYTPGWDSRLKKLRRNHTSTVSGPVVLTDLVMEFLASLGDGVNVRGQNKTGSSDEAKM